MAIPWVQEHYSYHRWANHRLFDFVAGLGDEVASRDVGKQFSYPTIARMFGHIYGADRLWLNRWKGGAPGPLAGSELPTLAAVRSVWAPLENEQKGFLEALTPAELERVVEYKNADGRAFRVPLAPLLTHVANHATHHRSEIATMVTMISGSPPDTGMASYQIITSGQVTA
ncbi:MAG TPA: DinB family protein [Methylomirabilota bacterium]|nr:DinB family protein [Methylomirabilota bacterium]